jgi:hypothetical protein
MKNDLLERGTILPMKATRPGRLRSIAGGRAALVVVVLLAAFVALALMSNSMSVVRPRHAVATPRDLVSPTSAWPLQQQSLVIRRVCIDRPEVSWPSWCPVAPGSGR